MSHVPRPTVNLVLECGGGGAARHVLDLYQGLTRNGWPVRLLVSFVRADPLFKADLAQLPAHAIVDIPMHRRPDPSDLRASARLRTLLRGDGEPAIVHAHSTKAGLLVQAAVPSLHARLFTPHAFRGMDEQLSGWRATGIRAFERLISDGFDRVIAVSPSELTYAQDIGLARECLVYIPNGVDVEALNAAAQRIRRNRTSPRVTLGFVGRLVFQKNPETFMDCFRRVLYAGLDAQAVIIGDGPLRGSLESFCRSAGIDSRVRFLGVVDAASRMPEFDVLVHTSRYESMPYTLLEAIAARVPVVAVDNAGSREIIADKSRLVSDCEDAAELTVRTLRMLSDQPYRSCVLEADFAQMKRFDIAQMCRQVEAEYEAVLRGKLP